MPEQVEEQGQNAISNFLRAQQEALLVNTRGLKGSILMGMTSGQISPEVRRLLYEELLSMAAMVEVKG